jgi:hypothetical protein
MLKGLPLSASALATYGINALDAVALEERRGTRCGSWPQRNSVGVDWTCGLVQGGGK